MQIHQLNVTKGKRGQRVGRGGKRGTTSGRGTKGQKSRSGRRIRPAARDLIIRIPKRRGFRNKPKSASAFVLNLRDIAGAKKVQKEGPVMLDRRALQALGLIPVGYRGEVKMLGAGDIAFPVVLQGLKVSESAKAKVEKAGGRIA